MPKSKTAMNDLAGFTVTTLRLSDTTVQVLDLNDAGRLGYLKPSDEWFDLSEPLPDALQDAAHRLLEAGWLPEFEDPSTDATLPTCTVTPFTATEPGALDGWQIRCPCGTVQGFSLEGMAEREAREHEAWHAARGH